MYKRHDQTEGNYLKCKEIQTRFDVLQVLEKVDDLVHFITGTG